MYLLFGFCLSRMYRSVNYINDTSTSGTFIGALLSPSSPSVVVVGKIPKAPYPNICLIFFRRIPNFIRWNDQCRFDPFNSLTMLMLSDTFHNGHGHQEASPTAGIWHIVGHYSQSNNFLLWGACWPDSSRMFRSPSQSEALMITAWSSAELVYPKIFKTPTKSKVSKRLNVRIKSIQNIIVIDHARHLIY